MPKVRCWLAYTICFLFALPGCTPEEFDFCSNPIGTATKQSYHYGLICFQGGYNGCIRIEFNSSDHAFQSVIVTGGGDIYGSIVDVGIVDCVGGVDIKPTSGYSYRVAMKAHHGYVMKLTDGTYGRFYVDSITGSGTSSTVNLLWQYSY